MMKENCKTCRSSNLVDKATVEKSVKFQASVAKIEETFAWKERKEKIAALRESAEYSDLMEVKGLDSLAAKDTDPKDGSVYILCSDAEHLKDEKAEGGVVHKYYFKCPHFAIKD